MTYARDTEVTPERSRAEIERTLSRYGCAAFGYGWQDDRAVVSFKAHGRFVQFMLPMPDPDDSARNRSGARMSATQARQAHEKAIRQRWRALALCIKATLEAVESGIVTFEEAFLAHILLPNGETVATLMAPQIEQAYTSGLMPAGLQLALPAGDDG